MINLKLDDKGDLVIENNDLALVSGDAELIQLIKETFRTNLGEWFLNENEGFPYIDYMNNSKIGGQQLMEEYIYSTMEQIDRIQNVQDIEMEYLPEVRKLRVKFTAVKIGGEELEVTQDI